MGRGWKFSTPAYNKLDEFSLIPEVKEKAEATVEFSPVSMPDMVMQLEDIFTYYEF